DVETTSTDPMTARLVGIALATSGQRSFYVPVNHANDDEQLDADEVREALSPLLADPNTVVYAHPGKYDALVLERAGYPPQRRDRRRAGRLGRGPRGAFAAPGPSQHRRLRPPRQVRCARTGAGRLPAPTHRLRHHDRRLPLGRERTRPQVAGLQPARHGDDR